jgi:hypothetical protein
MSLNKFTSSTDYLSKQYLNIGCNDIRCTSIEIKGVEVIPRLHSTYIPAITSSTGTFSNTYAYWSFEEVYFDIWFTTELLVTNSGTFIAIDLPYPPSFTSPVGTVVQPCGTLTAIYGGGAVGAMQQNQVNTAGNGLNLGFSFNGTGTAPANGTTVFINGNLRVYVNPLP